MRELRAAALGAFDYVIAHGVYGWVAPGRPRCAARRDRRPPRAAGRRVRLLPRLPGRLLPPHAARDGPVPRARRRRRACARAEAARELFGVLAELRADRGDAYGGVLARELPRLLYRPAGSLVHDDLADEMAPVWFADFAAHAAAHGLAFVCEVEVGELRPGPAAGGRRAAPARAGRRRPAGARAVRRLPARAQVPPERAVPCRRRRRRSIRRRVHRLRAASAEPAVEHPDPLVAPLVRVLARHFPEALAVARPAAHARRRRGGGRARALGGGRRRPRRAARARAGLRGGRRRASARERARAAAGRARRST